MSTNSSNTARTSNTHQPDLSEVSALLRRQADTSAALAGCVTFVQMASAIARHMLVDDSGSI